MGLVRKSLSGWSSGVVLKPMKRYLSVSHLSVRIRVRQDFGRSGIPNDPDQISRVIFKCQ